MLRIVLASAVLLPILAACAVTNVKMTDDKGHTGKCSAFGAGVIGTVVALGMTQHCVEEHKKQGFHTVPDSTVPGSPATTATDQKK